ncbi:MAG: hypothetical protein AB7S26_33315 [Sandaracinaceae bacterium]
MGTSHSIFRGALAMACLGTGCAVTHMPGDGAVDASVARDASGAPLEACPTDDAANVGRSCNFFSRCSEMVVDHEMGECGTSGYACRAGVYGPFRDVGPCPAVDCMGPSDEGAPCDFEGPCFPYPDSCAGYRCTGGRIDVFYACEPQPDGSYCLSNADCTSGFCYASPGATDRSCQSMCIGLGAEEGTCNDDADCCNGFCCVGCGPNGGNACAAI